MDGILEDLKARTAPSHKRLEQRLDLTTRLASVETFQQVLVAFYGFYAPVEAELSQVANLLPGQINFAMRRKTPALVADLGHWNIAAAELPICHDLLKIDSPGAALGCMYVLEGATLGGQIIKRLLNEKLAITAASGGAFFTAYGDRVRDMWNEFREATSQYASAHPEEREPIVQAACETFARFEAWLCQRLPAIKPDSSGWQ